jgi:universal stress protein A
MLKPTKILVPTDFSEYSDKALGQALDIAQEYGSDVYLFHVIYENVHQWKECVEDYCRTPEQIRQMVDQMRAGVKKDMKKQLAKFPKAKEVKVVTGIGEGTSYEAILQEAQEKGVDLIVIASLGRTGLAKYLVGSVASNVLRGAQCPVLLTR